MCTCLSNETCGMLAPQVYWERYLLSGIVLLLTSGAADAVTIFSTFGPGNTYNACCGFGTVFPSEIAYPFVVPPGPDFVFTSATLALALEPSFSTNMADISLATDTSNQPGVVLEIFHLVNALGPAGSNNP